MGQTMMITQQELDAKPGFYRGADGPGEYAYNMKTDRFIKAIVIDEFTGCKRCGSSKWHGARFTTDPASGLCDDCYG